MQVFWEVWGKMIIGYTRISTKEQDDSLQKDALEKYGVDKIYSDKVSSVKDRQELNRVLDILRSGDTLVVWKLDRLGRTTKELLDLVDGFNKDGINFVSLQEQIDTTTATGKFILTVLCALATMERDVLISRVNAGLEAARARGRIGGRPKTDGKIIIKALKLYDTKTHSINEICEICKISSSTLYRSISKRKCEVAEISECIEVKEKRGVER